MLGNNIGVTKSIIKLNSEGITKLFNVIYIISFIPYEDSGNFRNFWDLLACDRRVLASSSKSLVNRKSDRQFAAVCLANTQPLLSLISGSSFRGHLSVTSIFFASALLSPRITGTRARTLCHGHSLRFQGLWSKQEALSPLLPCLLLLLTPER